MTWRPPAPWRAPLPCSSTRLDLGVAGLPADWCRAPAWQQLSRTHLGVNDLAAASCLALSACPMLLLGSSCNGCSSPPAALAPMVPPCSSIAMAGSVVGLVAIVTLRAVVLPAGSFQETLSLRVMRAQLTADLGLTSARRLGVLTSLRLSRAPCKRPISVMRWLTTIVCICSASRPHSLTKEAGLAAVGSTPAMTWPHATDSNGGYPRSAIRQSCEHEAASDVIGSGPEVSVCSLRQQGLDSIAISIEVLGECKLPAPSKGQGLSPRKRLLQCWLSTCEDLTSAADSRAGSADHNATQGCPQARSMKRHKQCPPCAAAGSSHLAAAQTTKGRVRMHSLVRTRGQMGAGNGPPCSTGGRRASRWQTHRPQRAG